MKKRYIVLLILLCLVLIAGVLFGPKLYRAVRVYRLAERFLTQPEQSLDITVQTEGNRNVDFRLDWQTVGEKTVFTLESDGESVYYCGGVLYLKNGKGYDFSGALPDLTPVLEHPWTLYPLLQIQYEEDRWLLSVSTEEILPEIRNMNVTLEEQEGQLQTLYCSTWGAQIGDFVGLKAVVNSQREVPEVPQAVFDAIESGAVQAGKDLTEDLIRLIRGWLALNSRDPLGMEVELNVAFLSLPLNSLIRLYTTNAYGIPISYLDRDGTGFYFTQGAACTPQGVKIGTPDASMDTAKLLGLAYSLCFNGDLSCEGDVYRLMLDQAGMEQVLCTVVPEAGDMALDLTQGTLELKMTDDAIDSVSIQIEGQVDLLITRMDIGAQVQIRIMQQTAALEIPQAVLDALLE